MTEQRYRAVLEVQAGVPVTEVGERFGVSRQAVHRWIGWYRNEGLAGLSDRSHRPHGHPAQTSPAVEAVICELRRTHPRWGQRRIEFELAVTAARPGPLGEHDLPGSGAARPGRRRPPTPSPSGIPPLAA